MATKDISDIQVLKAYERYRANPYTEKWPYEILAKETGECEKVCFRACERACRRGLIDYGVSLRSGWLTEKGKEVLTKIIEYPLKGE